ncbi:MAG: hypothetical protein ACO305_15330 [Rubrivivax sp.]
MIHRRAWVQWAVAACMGAVLGPSAFAQAGGGAGPGPGAGATAGPGPGPRAPAGAEPAMPAPRGGARWGEDVTPGWSMMTERERAEHQERMREMKTRQDCMAYMEKHREDMAERARERGREAMRQTRRDACAGLPSR